MRDRLVQFLASAALPVYAIMDGARDRSITGIVKQSGFRYRTLYEGPEGEELAPFGPYLVEVPRDSKLLEPWIVQTWGKTFGVHLSCEQPFDVVRRHLRRFLMVELEDGRKVYFRFYDPRVLRTFLPNCTHEEWNQFFGPIDAYLVESERSDHILLFDRDADQPDPERLMFALEE